jgi:steroid delta-isomerase-like uncharacterized protein
MSAETKALIRRYAEEIWNKGNLAVANEVIAPNFSGFFPGLPEFNGLEGFKQRFASMYTAFPDLQVTIEDIFAEGNKVVARWTMRGTHKGDLMGLAPTSKQVKWTAIVIYHIVGGKIEKMWGEVDNIGLMQQLGVVPQ